MCIWWRLFVEACGLGQEIRGPLGFRLSFKSQQHANTQHVFLSKSSSLKDWVSLPNTPPTPWAFSNNYTQNWDTTYPSHQESAMRVWWKSKYYACQSWRNHFTWDRTQWSQYWFSYRLRWWGCWWFSRDFWVCSFGGVFGTGAWGGLFIGCGVRWGGGICLGSKSERMHRSTWRRWPLG